MKKLTKKLMALALTGIMLCGITVPASAAISESAEPFVALGNDLTDDQKATVLDLLGLDEERLEKCDVVYITNDQEHKYLDSYIDSSTIGTKSLSSVVVIEGEEGSGINVSTHNINYCTSGMYANALATAGISDAEVIVAGPFEISGTAALIGAIEAYSVMSGKRVKDSVIDGAIEELVVTGAIESNSSSDNENIEGMVSYLKEQLEDSKNLSDDELREEIKSAADEFNVELTDGEVSQLLDLLKKLQGLDLDWGKISKQAQSIYEKLKNAGININFDNLGINFDKIDTEAISQNAGSIIDKLLAFIKMFFTKK